MKKKFGGILGLVIGLMLLPLVAYSDLYINSPNAKLSSFTGPYASITVSLNNLGTEATITETALNGFGIVDGGSLGLNVNGSYVLKSYTGTIASTGLSNITWKQNSPVEHDAAVGAVGDFGYYDLVINQQSSNAPLSSLTVVLSGSWSDASQVLALDSSKDQTYLAAGHFSKDGITGYAAATPTPIPAAAWLFGSGLLGMIGLRRRKSA